MVVTVLGKVTGEFFPSALLFAYLLYFIVSKLHTVNKAREHMQTTNSLCFILYLELMICAVSTLEVSIGQSLLLRWHGSTPDLCLPFHRWEQQYWHHVKNSGEVFTKAEEDNVIHILKPVAFNEWARGSWALKLFNRLYNITYITILDERPE